LTDRVGNLPVAVVNPQTGKVYPANAPIPPADIASFANTVLTQLPTPTGPGRSNNYQQLLLNRNYNDKFDAKIDDQFNSKMSGFLRIGQRKVNIFNQPDIAGPSGGNSNGYTRVLNQQGVAAFNWVVTPTSILEARFAISRTNAGKQPPAVGGPSVQDLYGITGLPTDPSLTGGFTPSTITGFNALGRQATNPQFQNPLNFDPKVNFSKLLGRHSLKFGYEFEVIRIQVLDVNPLYGRDAYAGSFSKPTCAQLGQAAGCTVPSDSASYALADFLFGLRSQYALGNDVVGNYRQHEQFFYIQDDYKVSNKLSLNLGVRYEYASPMWERDNVLSNFNPATNSIIKAGGGSTYNRALVNPDLNNWGPRVGFAYSYDSKLVVRGGYGISYIHQNRVGSGNELGINGPQVVIATVNQTNPLDPTFRTTQQGYPIGLATPANFNPVLSNITYIPANLPDPYVQSWFFSVQRELARNLVLDVAYVGNHSVSLPVMSDYNQALPQPTANANLSLQARRPDQSFGAITWYNPAGFSNYNALQVKLEKRLSGGLYFLNAFTWSKAIDNGAQSLDNSNGNAASPQDVRNMASEKGPSNYDLTLTNITSVVYQLPFGKGRRYGSNIPGYLDAALGGWELTAINTALSSPVINLRAWNGTVPSAFQVVGNLPDYRGGESFRPNVTGDPLAVDSLRTTDNYFNKANVALPTDPSHPFGNAGRNSVRALPLNTLDLGIQKSFALPWEGARIQFRSEFFNVFNHTNFAAPNSDVSSAAFGTIRSTFPARQIQFGLKLMF
jgi:hypothetical protein